MKGKRETKVTKKAEPEAKIDQARIKEVAKDLATKTTSDEFNLLKMCNLHEPDHTRILDGILNYKEQGDAEPHGSRILENFIAMLNGRIEADADAKDEDFMPIEFNNPSTISIKPEAPAKTENNGKKPKNGRMDETITWIDNDSRRNRIIIENKCNGAGEGDQQLDRYVEATFKEGIENIFVVYLTLDGEAADPTTLKENSGKVTNGYAIRVNYMDDILPWLEEKIVPDCKMRDEKFVLALRYYIEYMRQRVQNTSRKNQEVEREALRKLGLEFQDGENNSRLSMRSLNAAKELRSNLLALQQTSHDASEKEALEKVFEALNRCYSEPQNALMEISREYWKSKGGRFRLNHPRMNKKWEASIVCSFDKYVQKVHVQYLLDFPKDWNDELYSLQPSEMKLELCFKKKNKNFHIKHKSAEEFFGEYNGDEESRRIQGLSVNLRVANEEVGFNLNRPFAELSDDQRETFLRKLYDKAFDCLNFVHKKLDEEDAADGPTSP